MEWGGHWGQWNRFPGICLTSEENPRKPQLGNRWGHLIAWPVIASNGVPFLEMKSVRPCYLLLLAKPIGPSQKKSILKNLRFEDPGSTPPGHSSKIQLLKAYPLKRKFFSSYFTFSILLLTKGTVCPKAFFFSFITLCLMMLICGHNDANQLSEGSAALSPLPFVS